MATVTLSTIDRQSKPTSMSIGAADAVLDADVQSLSDALDAVLRGPDSRAVITVPNVVDQGSAVPPADKEAQRGNKWLFRVQSAAGADIGKKFQHEIGTADNTVLTTATDDFLDLTAGVGLALKTAFETVWRSPIGSAGTLLSVQQTNRGEN